MRGRIGRTARIVLLAMVAALDLAAGGRAASRPAAAAPTCPDVLILGLRGHGDPVTVTNASGQRENFMGDDVTALVNDYITPALTANGWSVAHDGIPYTTIDAFSEATNPGSLTTAIQQSRHLIVHARDECPDSAIMLIGQSEGAAILHQMALSVPYAVAVLLGDPLHQPDQSYNWNHLNNNGNGLMYDGWLATWHVLTAILQLEGLPGPAKPVPNPVPFPAESFCLSHDPIGGGAGLDRTVHTTYRFNVEGVLTAASQFATGIVQGDLEFRGAKPVFPPPFVAWQSLPAPTGADAVIPPPPKPADVFVYNATSGASFVDFADGNGGWSGVQGPTFSPGWTIHTGRFNGDGLTDLFDYNAKTGASFVDLANGGGGWTGVKGPTFSPGWQMFTGRFNGDGLTDLFDYNPSTGASFVDLADGSGGWTGIKGPTFSTGWTILTGEFNDDRLTDLFDYNPTTGASFVDLADGGGGWRGVAGPTFSAGWQIHTGDFNADGLTDLFDYNPSTGASFVDFADGGGHWAGIAGPRFSSGWTVFTGTLH